MSIISLASAASASRGYDYYMRKKVLCVEQIGASTYHGGVSGSNGEIYDVTIDTAHARKSACTCPHAAGKRIICKHMVAMYFTVFPKEAEQYWHEMEEAWQEEERIQEEIEARLEKVIRKMNKAQLQEALMDLLSNLEDWQYDQFVCTYVDLDDLDYE